ncbi:MAG: glycosyltransferase [Myxococcales bacterium]|nr:glycosyltransferase [Myxococcales bacterium]
MVGSSTPSQFDKLDSDPQALLVPVDSSAPNAATAHQPESGCRTTVVLPCLNGSAYLDSSLRTLFDFLDREIPEAAPYEVILVDDGSDDGTSEIAARFDGRVKVLTHALNCGKGAAVRTGIQAARGEFIFFIDADIPYALSAMSIMLDALDRKEFDLCLGTRSLAEAQSILRPSFIRRVASAIFSEFVSRIVVTGIRDTQCGFKGFRADAAHYLFSQSRIDGFAFDVELVYLAFKNNFDMKKVPVKLVRDENSNVSLMRDAPLMLLSVLRLPFHYYLGHYQMQDSQKQEGSQS